MIDLSAVFNTINILFLKHTLILVSILSHTTGFTSLFFSLLLPLLVIFPKTHFPITFKLETADDVMLYIENPEEPPKIY